MKKTEEWERNLIASLPERPSQLVETFEPVKDELGPALILYKRESRTPMDWEAAELLGIEKEIRYHWTATCTCTECGEEFFAPWGKNSFYVVIGEDNETYANFFSDEEAMTSEIQEGDSLFCPNCGQLCTAQPAMNLKNGRTFRTQAASLENIGGTTVLIYWLYTRYLNRNGYGAIQVTPREAIAIDPDGNLKRYSHTRHYMTSETWAEHWEKRATFSEPELLIFQSEGMRKVGSYYIPFSGDMSGTTGEKSGIDDYWGGSYPSEYLKIWKRHWNIENLARSGAADLLSMMIDSVNSTYINNKSVKYSELDNMICWKEKKPNRMLGLRKEDYRRITANAWTAKMLTAFQDYLRRFPETKAEQFEEYVEELSIERINRIHGIWDEGLDKIIRYLEKQTKKEHSERIDIQFQLFVDYRDMMLERNIYADLGELTEAEKYPPCLRRAHDRIAREHNERRREEEQRQRESRQLGDVKAYGEQFSEIYKKYAPLEYSDGEICIVIPQSPIDLIKEGHILNHCVGGYSQQHCSGRPIFFVRHARRPERSWFTLNEDLTGETARRIQLHGYGNEYAHGHQLNIPERVKDFVEKWERDILKPWFEAQSGRIKKTGKETAA